MTSFNFIRAKISIYFIYLALLCLFSCKNTQEYAFYVGFEDGKYFARLEGGFLDSVKNGYPANLIYNNGQIITINMSRFHSKNITCYWSVEIDFCFNKNGNLVQNSRNQRNQLVTSHDVGSKIVYITHRSNGAADVFAIVDGGGLYSFGSYNYDNDPVVVYIGVK